MTGPQITAGLVVPEVAPNHGTLDAAVAYAAAGWYVGPVKVGTKHPGSLLGNDWPRLTSRDPQVFAAWYAGTDHGVFLHAGRSGAVVFDVDNPDNLVPPIRQALEQYKPPFQSSRPNIPGKGHQVFGMPAGRHLGNSLGRLAGGWGEIRGLNGVIVVTPTIHPDGGEYRWLRTGPVPVLPGYLATQLPDAMDASEAATDADVAAFLAQHSTPSSPRPQLLDIHVRGFQKAVSAGESRHGTMPGHLSGAMKEAAAGYLDAKTAADTLESVFLEAVAQPPTGKQGDSRNGAIARNEWRGLLAWAVGQARTAEPEETRLRIGEKFGKYDVALHPDDEALADQAALGPDFAPARIHDAAGNGQEHDDAHRHVVLTRASDIKAGPVYWLWEARLALGTLALLAGREGVGKSILAYTIAAMITRGILPGQYFGTPKSVLVAAAEDSWSQTIVPRLIAAGADLDRVYRVEIETDGIHDELAMPRDLPGVRASAGEVDAALLILDPLISRLDDRLDTHKDADVRRALEPLVAMAGQAGLSVWGLIHHNKSGSADPLQVVMASKAFTAVPRSVHTVISDPDDEGDRRRLFGTPKNNLGRTDLPTLSFTIESFGVAIDGTEELAWTGRLVWGDDSTSSIFDVMRRSTESADEKSATTEAAEWLDEFLQSQAGSAPSAAVKAAGRKAGHSEDALKRARKKLKLHVSPSGFPRITYWHCVSESRLIAQSEQQLEQPPRGEPLTALTAPTEGQNPQSVQLVQLEQAPGTRAPDWAPPLEIKRVGGPADPVEPPAGVDPDLDWKAPMEVIRPSGGQPMCQICGKPLEDPNGECSGDHYREE